MDRTVPAGAAVLLDFIRRTEVGTEGPEGYDVIYGHNQDKLEKPITSMTLEEVQRKQSRFTRRFGSSATGGYQFMKATLKGLISELGLSMSQKLDADLQDRLGYHLLIRRGYHQFIDGAISRAEFGKRLAQEWASFPVLTATRGAHRKLERGHSYYSGDRLNKALVPPERVEAVIDKAMRATQKPPKVVVEKEEVVKDPENLDKPMRKSKTFWTYLTMIFTAIAGIFERLNFINLDWRVQVFMLAVVIALALYGIYARHRIAAVYRDLKREFGTA